jgi:aldehyde:ferredoxin oxidoreductase
LFVIQTGPDSGSYGEGLELTTIDFGPKMGSEDLSLVAKLHALLDEYGIDYFETTTLIAFATECFEKGILSRNDTDGLELQWGSAKSAHSLIEKIIHKEGIGALLAEGVKRASEAIGKGAEELAMQTKGQTFAGRDPRTSKGWGLGYAVASRGACHVRAHLPEAYPPGTWDASVQSILDKYDDPTSPYTENGKGELVKWHEDLVAVKNSMQICLFALYPWMVPSRSVPDALSELYYGVTGIRLTEEQLLSTGERIVNIERAFNIREGLTRKDDTLPERMLKVPYPDGPAKGQVVHLEKMLHDYYQFRDWDGATGFPRRRKMMELGLKGVADDLARMERLAT